MRLSVLSWNIWYHGNFEQISAFLKKENPDIIGLQEVVPDDPSLDIIGYLTKLGYCHVFSPVLKLKDGRTMGNAVFSKYEIVKSKTHTLSEIESRKAVYADVKIGETTLHVITTHLLHTHQQFSNIQEIQVKQLVRMIPKSRSIVMGDFNATPESSVIQTMRKTLQDTDPISTPTLQSEIFTCKGCNPETIASTRLDYIFTTKDILTTGFRVEKVHGSDHLPILINVEL